MPRKVRKYSAVVIGASAGGLEALSVIIPSLHKEFPLPVLVVQHISRDSGLTFITYLDNISGVRVKEALDKESLQSGTVYFAPPDYHLMVESSSILTLSNEVPVNYSRPSIDVLFETASWVFGNRLIGVILTGASHDGAYGLACIAVRGGYCIIQDPATAFVPRMPGAALERVKPDSQLPVEKIGPLLNLLAG
ncbi:MAG: chemotaxis protein CheB [Bacteroidales bacterium]|nr:chemotaxis protein CheB [Bacteroidales bacterium]